VTAEVSAMADTIAVVTYASATTEGFSLTVTAAEELPAASSLGDFLWRSPTAFAMIDLVTVEDTTVVLAALAP